MTSKQLIVVGGPNGCGKTTFALEFLSRRSCIYLSADAIAAEISPADPAAAQVAAGRLFLERVAQHLAHSDECLLLESTLSGLTLRHTLHEAKARGFEVSILFVFLDSAEACIARVKERVRKGGHHVPEFDVRRRFTRSYVNFWHTYRPIADDWMLIYNAVNQFLDVANGSPSSCNIISENRFHDFLRHAERR